jgi:hypothetical protein
MVEVVFFLLLILGGGCEARVIVAAPGEACCFIYQGARCSIREHAAPMITQTQTQNLMMKEQASDRRGRLGAVAAERCCCSAVRRPAEPRLPRRIFPWPCVLSQELATLIGARSTSSGTTQSRERRGMRRARYESSRPTSKGGRAGRSGPARRGQRPRADTPSPCPR